MGRRIWTFVFVGVLWAASARAEVVPADLLLVYNSAFEGSRNVARYYAEQRKVPKKNLLSLTLPAQESMTRQAFMDTLLPKVQARVNRMRRKGRQPVVVLMYGVPLRISPQTQQDNLWVDRFAWVAKMRPAAATELTKALIELDEVLPEKANPAARKSSNGSKQLAYASTRLRLAQERLRAMMPIPGNQEQVWELRRLVRKIAGSGLSRGEKTALQFLGAPTTELEQMADTLRANAGLMGVLNFWWQISEDLNSTEDSAAVDSELSVALAGPSRWSGWLPNPFLSAYDRTRGIRTIRARAVRVARLDGPTAKVVKRMIDDAITVEQTGLQGTFYIDARGMDTKNGPPNSYAGYDTSLRRLSQMLQAETLIPVVLNNQPEVMAPETAPNAALYVGWYSVGKYVPAFDWKPGAVGFHMASAEATQLRHQTSTSWCKRMLESGVAATLGPVEEPYIQSFPVPDQFFPLLLSGELPLVDVYFRTIPQLSWRQVLIGDPLYTPFKVNPHPMQAARKLLKSPFVRPEPRR